MARLIETIAISSSADLVWKAVSDAGSLDQMVPQLVAACDYDADHAIRTVTFQDGSSLIEPIIANHDTRRELVWTAQGGSWTHHNATVTVTAAPDNGCTVQWVADVLPHSEAATVEGIMRAGLAAMKETLEANGDA